MVSILIGADICPIERNLPYFKRGDAQSLLNDLLPEFENADLSIANLECPLIEKSSPIRKTGPTFGESVECINGIHNCGIDVLCLANNHIMDHGPSGLKSTLDTCSSASIRTVGAGENLEAARRILVCKVGGIRVGILAVAEHEFSIATSESYGANPVDLIDFVRNVTSNRNSYDYLIVLFHGGHEFHVPSPGMKNMCHFMVEMGANAVIMQHSHCVGGYEQYLGSHIIYGQGALIMDEKIYRKLGTFHKGFLVKLQIREDLSSVFEPIPFVHSVPVPGARKMRPENSRIFKQSLEDKSSLIKDDKYVKEQWLQICNKEKWDYLNCILGYNRLMRGINVGGLLMKFMNGEKGILGIKNCLSCETHREALETIIADLIN